MDHRPFLIDFLIILVLQLYVIDSLTGFTYTSQVSHVRHRLYMHVTGFTYTSQVSYAHHRFHNYVTGFTYTSHVSHTLHRFHIHVTYASASCLHSTTNFSSNWQVSRSHKKFHSYYPLFVDFTSNLKRNKSVIWIYIFHQQDCSGLIKPDTQPVFVYYHLCLSVA